MERERQQQQEEGEEKKHSLEVVFAQIAAALEGPGPNDHHGPSSDIEESTSSHFRWRCDSRHIFLSEVKEL